MSNSTDAGLDMHSCLMRSKYPRPKANKSMRNAPTPMSIIQARHHCPQTSLELHLLDTLPEPPDTSPTSASPRTSTPDVIRPAHALQAR